jgi:ribosomal protein S1
VQHPDYRWADGLRSSLAAAAHFLSGADTSSLAAHGLSELLRLAPLLVMHDLTLAAVVVGPADADLVRSAASAGLPESERQWRELKAAMASRSTLPCRVIDRNSAGVIVRVLGHTGRIRTHELAWRAEDRAEAPDLGDSVHAVVIDIDEERRRVELSVRRVTPGPWDANVLTLSPGDWLDVTVTRVVPFGVFTTTPSGLDGLIHITELSDAVSPDGDGEPLDLEERYPVATVLRARVLEVRPDVEELSLSLRDPELPAPPAEATIAADVDVRARTG